MTNFKNQIDNELSHLKFNQSLESLLKTAKTTSLKTPVFKNLVAAAVAIVLLTGLCFAPNLISFDENSFVIQANAKSLGAKAEEITAESPVEIISTAPNYIKYNFSYILDDSADSTNLVQKYLVYTIDKSLDITVEGDDIETVTYKINQGSLTASKAEKQDDGTTHHYFKNSSSDNKSSFTIDYDEQDNWNFSINPILPKDSFFRSEDMFVALDDTGEIKRKDEIQGENKVIGYGYKNQSEPLATDEEINALKSYISSNDMVGFFNCQNKIFERVINNISLDITALKTNGETQTKTLQFIYTPDTITNADNYLNNQKVTLSTGKLYAVLK